MASFTRRRLLACGLLLLLPALSIPGCRGEAPSDDLPVRVAVSVAPTPPIVGPNRLVLDITDDQGAELEAAAVRIEGTMTHAGMVPVFDTATHQGGGRWVVPEFDFTMGGEWILIIQVELPDGREATRRHELNVVGRGAAGGAGGAR
ncbi:MAG: hypothetical protein EA422_09865 [Gemmatimonadales bacterium]|nr:MAG: hypothetical protein EA422_09865 [Gemmatimonadales bacterium]